MAAGKRLCEFAGCTRDVKSRNLCTSHYGQYNAGRDLRPLRPRRTESSVKRTNRDIFLWVTYKMTLEEFDLLASEGCAFCGSRDDLVVDHDHICCPGKRSCGSCVRGVLCRVHNVWLGMINDDPVLLERALAYLKARVE